ncbi:LacI family DNA-binding transcriptional regulator [Rathayibacter sp. Leaf296]|uniref:LacI family DNA-binding transcriptional regulator n=1 Tax=Rathayibacter sp. Leaf296 TaxID=1736327 RepID=UPI0007036FFE|nr:LacI family DNA-binding transcriptional regulator [Rathayibacter sp. Leaf296]KQQ08663.1 hypothetical protein ASF46_15460 [Rathayibacter sp. Leaf296]
MAEESLPARAPAKQATIYDVARVAGVSHQTVTRFLQGFEGIRPATRSRVEAALAELDYRPNLTARSLRARRSHRIGALTHEIDQVGPSKILQGASTAAREAGYVLDIVSLDMSDSAAIEEALDLVTQHELAGVLALASTDEMTRAFRTTRFRVPAHLAVEEDDDATGSPSQLTTQGFPALVAHLADLGHREFLHLAGPPTWSAARNRRKAYESAVTRHGLHSTAVLEGDWSARSGYELIRGLDELRATAIVAANDQMALGAVLALTDRGLRVPEDVSVTGVDDIPEAAYLVPPLTTLRVDFAGQGRSALGELLALIDGVDAAPHVTLASELVPRRSSGPAPR